MSAVEVLARARCERHWRTPCDMAGCTKFSCEWRKGAEADLAALSAAGLVVVPKEPTEKMLQTFHDTIVIQCRPDKREASVLNDIDVWNAMIAAAREGK